jgi:hypothetical protein
MNLKEIRWENVDRTYLIWVRLQWSAVEHGNESSLSLKAGEFEYLSDYKFIKEICSVK